MGRALYRESGPSQDGDPVPGNKPYFNTLEKASFHFLARLPFSYTLKLRARIGTLLNLNVFKSNNNAFVEKLF